MIRYLRMYKNRFLLVLGFTLVNKHGYTVKIIDGVQVWDNPLRKKPYSLDDSSWTVLL